MAAIVLPYDFSRRLKSGKPVKMQLIADGTNANTANLIITYAQGIAAAYNRNLLVQRLQEHGMTYALAPLTSEPRLWFNEDMESRNFIVPGLIAIIMTIVGALLTALCVIREKERGSMEGLMGTPLKKYEFILGKLGPYFLIGMVDMFIAMAMGQFLFEVPFRGSLPPFYCFIRPLSDGGAGTGAPDFRERPQSIGSLSDGHPHHLPALLSAFRGDFSHRPDAADFAMDLLSGPGHVSGEHQPQHLFERPRLAYLVAECLGIRPVCAFLSGRLRTEIRQEDQLNYVAAYLAYHHQRIYPGGARPSFENFYRAAPHHSAFDLRVCHQFRLPADSHGGVG